MNKRDKNLAYAAVIIIALDSIEGSRFNKHQYKPVTYQI